MKQLELMNSIAEKLTAQSPTKAGKISVQGGKLSYPTWSDTYRHKPQDFISGFVDIASGQGIGAEAWVILFPTVFTDQDSLVVEAIKKFNPYFTPSQYVKSQRERFSTTKYRSE